MGWDAWPAYVTIATRRERAKKQLKALQKKKGMSAVQPIVIEGRQIVSTFWGKAWCDNLKSYSDLANRLKRGSSYVKNGFVIDLSIQSGKVDALVYGSEIYTVCVTFAAVNAMRWDKLVKGCKGQIGSLIELIQGKLSKHIMTLMTDAQTGLFPHPKEITFSCTCPDYATMCKHIAATLYGVGVRLDAEPTALFTLRHVNYEALLSAVDNAPSLMRADENKDEAALEDLSAIFGIQLAGEVATVSSSIKKKTPIKSVKVKSRKKSNG